MKVEIYSGPTKIFDSSSATALRNIVGKRLTLDVDKAAEFEYTMLPGHPKYDTPKRMSSIIRVLVDDTELFRGRILTEDIDTYKQKTVHCEGDRTFLGDTIMRPFEVNEAASAFFSRLISNHNAQVDVNRRFTVGRVTVSGAATTVKLRETGYASTKAVMQEKLLDVFGGYIKTYTNGSGQRVIDWLADYEGGSGQAITFAVNLLDIHDKSSGDDVFTMLIPLGAPVVDAEGNIGETLTIASINSGHDYIEDAAGVAAYGRIWRTHTWDNVETATELLAKGQAMLATGAALRSLSVKAVDMHALDGDEAIIREGSNAHITSNPHGIDATMMCVLADIDLDDVEQSQYTFGRAPRTLSENVAASDAAVRNNLTTSGSGGRGGGRSKEDGFSRWADVKVKPNLAYACMIAGSLENGLTEAGITVDGLSGAIESKVEKNGVISCINQTSEQITIQARKINLSGYVTASQLSATQADIDNLRSGYTTAQILRATQGYFGSLRIAEQKVALEQIGVITGVTFPTFNSKIIYYKDASGNTASQQVLTGISTAGSKSLATRYFVTRE